MSEKNKHLRQSYYEEPCTVCRKIPSDPCHIKSYGSGGADTEDNIIAMCREHHTEQHTIGWLRMCGKYPALFLALEQKGWGFTWIGNKRKLMKI